MQLHGDEQSDEIVWLEGMSTERRYVVTWPHGYTARLSPALELLNERGQQVCPSSSWRAKARPFRDPSHRSRRLLCR